MITMITTTGNNYVNEYIVVMQENMKQLGDFHSIGMYNYIGNNDGIDDHNDNNYMTVNAIIRMIMREIGNKAKDGNDNSIQDNDDNNEGK